MALATAVCLAACGSGGSDSASTAAATTASTSTGTSSVASAADEVKFLSSYLQSWYLWSASLPAIDPTAYASAQALLDAVRATPDRYSYITDAATFNAFYDEGTAVGAGFSYSALADGNVWIRTVQPLSNAGLAGLQRGDRIVAINGVAIASIIAGVGVDSALGPTQVGLTVTLTIARNGANRDLVLTKSAYPVRTVLNSSLITTAHGPVGYLVFSAFTSPSASEWNDAVAALKAGGATDIIVDLRENGGGVLTTADVVASSLAPVAASGSPALQLQFNAAHTASNQTLNYLAGPTSGQFNRLVWITSATTCSASEAVISALRPVRSAWNVGNPTCGKPVGFTPPQYNGKIYNIVTFRITNSAGFSDYYSGLTPDCNVAEDYSKPFGDPAEPKLVAALAWLDNGSCPSTTSGAVQMQSKSVSGAAELPQQGDGLALETRLR